MPFRRLGQPQGTDLWANIGRGLGGAFGKNRENPPVQLYPVLPSGELGPAPPPGKPYDSSVVQLYPVLPSAAGVNARPPMAPQAPPMQAPPMQAPVPAPPVPAQQEAPGGNPYMMIPQYRQPTIGNIGAMENMATRNMLFGGAANFGNAIQQAMSQRGELLQGNADRTFQDRMARNQWELQKQQMANEQASRMAAISSRDRMTSSMLGMLGNIGSTGLGAPPIWNSLDSSGQAAARLGALGNRPAPHGTGDHFGNILAGSAGQTMAGLNIAGSQAQGQQNLQTATAQSQLQRALQGLMAQIYAGGQGGPGTDRLTNARILQALS